MPYLIFPDRWRKQPQYPVDLDRNHYLAQNLVSAPLFSQGVLHDPATTLQWANSALEFSASDYGVSAYGTGSAHAEIASPISAYPFSGSVIYKPANLTDYIRLIGLGSAGNGRIIFFSDGPTANDPISLNRKDKTTTIQKTDRLDGQLNGWNVASFSVRIASSIEVMLNRSSLINTLDSYDVGPETFTHASIGRFYNANDYRLNGFIAFWALWARAISLDEHLALLENPWQIYRRDLGIVYFIPAATGATAVPVFYHQLQQQGIA